MSRPDPVRPRRLGLTARGGFVLGAGVVALCAAAALGRRDLLFVGLFLTCLVVVVLVVVARSRPDVDVWSRLTPADVTRGGSATRIVTVRNRGAEALGGHWRMELPAVLGGPRRGRLPRLMGFAGAEAAHDDRTTLRLEVAAEHRGVYDLPPLVLVRRGPFGLVRAEWAAGSAQRLVVTPDAVPLEERRTSIGDGHGPADSASRPSAPGIDEPMPRAYQPGDPLARVNWRATARFGRLMVRQEERRSGREAWLFLDTVAHRGDARERAAFETAADLVYSLGARLARSGYSFGLVETGAAASSGDPVPTEATASWFGPRGGPEDLARRLAEVELVPEERYEAAVRAVAARGPSRAVPVYAVVIGADARAVRWASALRRSSDPAVAFLVGDTAGGTEHALVGAGWTCERVPIGGDLAAAWSRVAAGTARHG